MSFCKQIANQTYKQMRNMIDAIALIFPKGVYRITTNKKFRITSDGKYRIRN